MNHTQWILTPEQRGRRSTLFEQKDTTWQASKWPAAYSEVIRGDGGIYSTLTDYTKFAQMLLNNGQGNGIQILATKWIKDLFFEEDKKNLVNTLKIELVNLVGKANGID